MIGENDLNVLEPVSFDNSITNFDYLTFKSFNSGNLKNNDEIRIPIFSKELITIPHQSHLYISGRIERNNSTSYIHQLAYNGLMHLFQSISYELNSVLIDRTLNVGVTSTIKSYLSKTAQNSNYYKSCGFNDQERNPYSSYTLTSQGYFQVYIPLQFLLGFAEDYRKPIFNSIQELILLRSRDDSNVFVHPGPSTVAGEDTAAHIQHVDPTVTLDEVSWKMPVIKLADYARLQLLNVIKDNRKIDLSFRTWDYYEYPTLPQTTQVSWAVRTSNSLLKPRHIIVAFQNDQRNKYKGNISLFDLIGLQTIRLYLNDEQYPQEMINLNPTTNQTEILYHKFAQFHMSYYGKPYPETSYSSHYFFDNVNRMNLIYFDCSKQKDVLDSTGSGPINIRIDFTCKENIPSNTTAYCIIIYDRLFSYYALNGNVKQIL